MTYEFKWSGLSSTFLIDADMMAQQNERARFAGWADWLNTFYPEACGLSLHWHIWNAPIYDLFTRKIKEAEESMTRILNEELFALKGPS